MDQYSNLLLIVAEPCVGGRHQTQLQSASTGGEKPRVSGFAPQNGQAQGHVGPTLLHPEGWLSLPLQWHPCNSRTWYEKILFMTNL